MSFVIKEINNKEIWENFLLGCQEKTFLQSWNWGEFQKKEGNKIWRLGIFSGRELFSVALVVKISAKRGTFLFVPHAPSVVLTKEGGPERRCQILKTLLNKLEEIAKTERASFIRVSPIWERNEENNKIFREIGFKKAPIHMHAEVTWKLDISKETEAILSGMRKTTRYLIRQAEKNKDIEIIQSQNPDDIKEFNKIYQETVARHHFTPFSLEYLKNQFTSFSLDNRALIFLGKYKGEIVSGAIIVFWQNIAFYHHGASLLKYQKMPTSYLLQWEAIKEAKKRGCKIYNFWGIVPVFAEAKTGISKIQIQNKKHPWYGLSLFKIGFGGYRTEYVKTQDFPLSKKYWLIYIFEKIRKMKRGL